MIGICNFSIVVRILFIISNFLQSKAIYLLYANIFYFINIFLYIVNMKTIKYKPILSDGGLWLVNYDYYNHTLQKWFWTKDQAERFIEKVI